MNWQMIVSFLVILLLLMFFVYPLLIVFRCNYVKFEPLIDKTDIVLGEDAKRCFSSAKLIFDEQYKKVFLQLTTKEKINYLDIYVAFKYKNHTAIRRYKISIDKLNDFSLKVSAKVLNVKIYINKINDEPKHEKNLRYISKKNLIIFSLLELLSIFLINILVAQLFVNYYLTTTNFVIYLTMVLGFIFVTLSDCLFVYFLIYQPLEKFNYGGMIDD